MKYKQNLGKAIDGLYKWDQQIDRQEYVLREMKRDRALMEEKLLKSFDNEDINGALGRSARATISKTRHPTIKDRAKLDRYIIKNRAFDLLQNRISSRAYFDRLEEGEIIPGVEIFTKVRVSVRKRS